MVRHAVSRFNIHNLNSFFHVAHFICLMACNLDLDLITSLRAWNGPGLNWTQLQQQIPWTIGCVDEKESACGMWQYTGIPGKIDIQIIIDAIISV